jgi:Ni/Fe-hydrogenase 1 B-type cytochrome subunit
MTPPEQAASGPAGSGGGGAAAHHISLAHPIPPPTGEYRWVYLWHWPIRAMHWIAVACIVVLAATGFYIGRPYFAEATTGATPYLMGYVRLTHFIAAGVLVGTGIIRGYWLFAGNRFERWRALFPVRRSDWVNLWRMIKYYLMIHPERAPRYLGHNPLQQFSYSLVYLAAAVMVITGFTLFGQASPEGFFYTVFAWVPSLLGGLQVVRFVHHVLTWFFLIFIPIHVYLAIRSDIMERSGAITSIVSGGRFVPSDEHYADD